MKYDRIKSAFPEFWYVVADEWTCEVLEKIRRELFQPDENPHLHGYFEPDRQYLQFGHSLVSQHHEDDSYYYTLDVGESTNTYYDKYIKLTFEDLTTILKSVESSNNSDSNTLFDNYYQL